MRTDQITSLSGRIRVPGDKSISHRSVILGALANGRTSAHHFLKSADCLSTIKCFQKMGISITLEDDTVMIEGKGLHGLDAPTSILDVGNSGTTMRLISGILSGQNFPTQLTGDASICRRPMGRVITPLTQMGAKIKSLTGNDRAPLAIDPSSLTGITYHTPIASAQVKSCILLAGLYADSQTTVVEPALSRDHTELMLRSFGADLISEDVSCTVQPNPTLDGMELSVPGDISSAAYFIAAGLLVPDSEILIQGVGINPTRDGILQVASAMGASIEQLNVRYEGCEKVADLLVRTSTLHGTTIAGSLIPCLIDEIPVIAVMATQAEGTTVIRDAAELKVKESNRLDLMVAGLKKMGADIEATDDGMIIHGKTPLRGTIIDSHLDHRIAMSFAVAGLIARGSTTVTRSKCVSISYPEFYDDLHNLI